MYNGSSWLFPRLPFEQKYKAMNRSGNVTSKREARMNQRMNTT